MTGLRDLALALPRAFGRDLRHCLDDPTVKVFGFTLLVLWSGFALFLLQPYRLVINRTDSEPLGLYLVRDLSPSTVLHRGELVSFGYQSPWPIPPYTGYPDGAGFLKHIAGMPGDVVTTRGRCQFVNGAAEGCAVRRTPSGTPVPYFAHFHDTVIPAGEFYMVGDGNPESYDSRYYGLVPRGRVIGAARLLWRW